MKLTSSLALFPGARKFERLGTRLTASCTTCVIIHMLWFPFLDGYDWEEVENKSTPRNWSGILCTRLCHEVRTMLYYKIQFPSLPSLIIFLSGCSNS